MTQTKTKQSVREALIQSKASRFKRELIELEGLDAEIYARQLSAAEVVEITNAMPEATREAVAKGDGDAAAEVAKGSGFHSITPWIIAALVDEDGKPVFGDDDADLVLDLFSADQLSRLIKAIMALNTMSAEGMVDAKND